MTAGYEADGRARLESSPTMRTATARRHGISRAQLLAWRRSFKPEREEAVAAARFVPAVIEPEPVAVPVLPSCARSRGGRAGRIEIVLSRGRRVIVDAGVDAAALSRILDVLERR